MSLCFFPCVIFVDMEPDDLLLKGFPIGGGLRCHSDAARARFVAKVQKLGKKPFFFSFFFFGAGEGGF